MTEELKVEVKFIRLNTGEDIIGSCVFDDTESVLIVDRPMKVVVQRGVDYGKAMLLMMPWLPLEVIDDNAAILDYDSILTTISPKQSFVEFYYESITKYEQIIEENKNDEFFFDDEPYLDGEEDDDESVEEFTDEEIDQMNEVIKERKKNLIH